MPTMESQNDQDSEEVGVTGFLAAHRERDSNRD